MTTIIRVIFCQCFDSEIEEKGEEGVWVGCNEVVWREEYLMEIVVRLEEIPLGKARIAEQGVGSACHFLLSLYFSSSNRHGASSIHVV